MTSSPPSVREFEKLGIFYLGRHYDLRTRTLRSEPFLLDAGDLTTHAVCVGMTGSGKTGLCIDLLEEAAVDDIPAIAIDVKGDIANLLLTFPELRGADFAPWVDAAAARRAGGDSVVYGEEQAARWREGLASWGLDGDRIRRMRARVDFRLYTPGSTSGRPLKVLGSLSPRAGEDAQARADRIAALTSGLLALLGLEADPLQSPEHVLLSNIIAHAWQAGRTLDLPELIRLIQRPPFTRLGVLDLDMMFPPAKRGALAIRLNSLLASPTFAAWLQGEALDVDRLLYTPEGRPRMSILSIAHLGDAERMFFVTTLLSEIVSWMRRQQGSRSLRALLYMDEVFGYFPPSAAPPSKLPMLTLLKQARAYGLGVVLATQNPVDLDYKGLSNAGLWMVGRLQTERDKARLLDGLAGASGEGGDRAEIDEALSKLDTRCFLVKNVHEPGLKVFQTRWAMSYLAGPLTQGQIAKLSAVGAGDDANAAPSPEPPVAPPFSVGAKKSPPAKVASSRPLVPRGVEERFLVPKGSWGDEGARIYLPALLLEADLHFARARPEVDDWRKVWALAVAKDPKARLSWDDARFFTEALSLSADPVSEVGFSPLCPSLAQAKSITAFARRLKSHLYRESTLTLWRCRAPKATSTPDETQDAFRRRLVATLREAREEAKAKIKRKFQVRFERIAGQLRRAEEKVAVQQGQVGQLESTAAIGLGATVLGAVFGGRLASRSNVRGVAGVAKRAARIRKEKADVVRAQAALEAKRAALARLEEQFRQELGDALAALDPTSVEIDELILRPRKSDFNLATPVLVWTPWRRGAEGLVPRF